MNNNQRKLFNVACRIEKVLYDLGHSEFRKKATYSSIFIFLKDKRITNPLIEELEKIIRNNNLDIEIFIGEENNLTIQIW